MSQVKCYSHAPCNVINRDADTCNYGWKEVHIHACIYSESAELHCHDYLLVMHLCYYQVFIVAVEIESVDHGTPMLPGKYFFHFMNIVK